MSGTIAAGWLLQTALGGGLLLLLTWALMACARSPARRQRLGERGVAAALVVMALATVAGLGLGPAWVLVALPIPAHQGSPAPMSAPREGGAGMALAPVEVDEGLWGEDEHLAGAPAHAPAPEGALARPEPGA